MTAEPLQVVPLDGELSVVAARRRARELSEAFAFSQHDQIRIATSVLEVARVVFLATSGGRAEFLLDRATKPTSLLIRFVAPATALTRLTEQPARAAGIDIDAGEIGGPLGLLAAQRLMDSCSIEDVAGDAIITLAKRLPPQTPLASAQVAAVLARDTVLPNAGNSFDEMQRQSHELTVALDELQERQEELVRLTRELEDTNRGVVALYAELDERAEHLRRADDAKSRFLSNMSHEFRSPLYSIRALSNLLIARTDGELTDEQAKQVRFIRKAADELSETVDDLLDLAKIEIRPSEFEVADLFSALRGMLRPLLPAADVDLVFERCDAIPPVYTDEGKVSQILRNLISNALKFTEKGEVRVRAQYDASQQILTFLVSDTGIGIAPEHQQSIFEEFEQVENRLQTFVKGTGLGLPLCSKLCKLLGGTVGLESEPGKGSTFSAMIQAHLPRLATDAPVAAPQPSARDAHGDMVLLVSTSLDDRVRYEASLHNTRYRPATAATVREAKSVLAVAAAFAVVLDMQAGREECWNWLAELRREEAVSRLGERGSLEDTDPRQQRMPVIVLSDTDQGERAHSMGADAFFIKPLSGNALLTSLDAMLSAT
ncbi:ATP-binding protein [Paraburkholderia sp. BCC1885]|uniref:ATP-binding response regulator n=1 Tax=Paraburkholderia sp. BCC1885 TaxID=2562669 RepID=UPI0011837C59|nr:ATP-binding protein [Paraburkholderia sp. BCC1885]